MALAERAELVARLSLKDDFSRGLAGAKRSVGGLNTALASTGRIAKGVALGSMIDRAVSAGVRGFFNSVRQGNESLQELEAVGLRTSAVIKSTGGVAGQTAEGIRKLSEELEDLTTNDDKAIQNTANLLLTFTGITKDGFEPALQAVLDLNAALGGGDEGLQGTAIQVGKALQDPIRGLTALRRVGVNFTADQEKLIKALVEEGKLFEAQQVILAELNKEFGGQAGAFGKGRAAEVRRLDDAVEDFNRTLAEGLAPAVDAGRKGLTQLLRDPAVLQGIKDLGAGIAGMFTPEGIAGGISAVKGVIAGLREVPWGVIGDSMKIAGAGAKALFDAFTMLPPWVQTAVLTGWGLNKLTGGALGGIVGELGKGLIKGVLGMNAAVVNINAGVVRGGGVPVGTAGAGGGGAALMAAGLLPGIAALVTGLLAEQANTSPVRDQIGVTGELQATTGLDLAAFSNLLVFAEAIPKLISELNNPTKPLPLDPRNLSEGNREVVDAVANSADRMEAVRIAIKSNALAMRWRPSTVVQIEDRRGEARDDQRIAQASRQQTSAIRTAQINQVAVTRTGDREIVAAIRSIQRPIVNVAVSASMTRVTYQTGTTLTRSTNRYAGKLIPI